MMQPSPCELSWADAYVQPFERALAAYIDALPWAYPEIQPIICYALLDGGKRLRPLLLLSMLVALDQPLTLGMPAACAIEMMHVFSLVHDDLPAMDDDAMRRGKPSVHCQFGEANAILVGDVLQGLAMHALVHADMYAPNLKLALLRHLTALVGPNGLIMGQWAEFNIASPSATLLADMHHQKTAKMFEVAAAMAAELSAVDVVPIAEMGRLLGQVYQLLDDLDDLAHDTQQDRMAYNCLNVSSVSSVIDRAQAMLSQVKTGAQDLPCPAPMRAYIGWFEMHLAQVSQQHT